MSEGLQPEQRQALVDLVGSEVAAEDEAAVESAYQDYRQHFDLMRLAFEQTTAETPEQGAPRG